jgi:hypothetical protein
LLPDSELIDIQRKASVGYGYRNIPFYTVSITFEEGKWNENIQEFSNLAKEFGFLQIYDSYQDLENERRKFKRGKYIRHVMIFYHENYIGF